MRGVKVRCKSGRRREGVVCDIVLDFDGLAVFCMIQRSE